MIIAATVLMLLHAPGGYEVRINPRAVTALRARSDDQPNKHFTEAARCMISLSDGKYVTVIEACETVAQMMENAQ